MPSAINPSSANAREEIILLRRMVQMLSQQNAVDAANRQRIVLDNISTGLTLGTITTVGTVQTVTGVTNIAAIAGEGVRQFEVPARNNYANSIRRNLVFG